MIATENADKIGEFSLTDSRLSRITKFMAETLFDENVGGEQGNTHLALGSAYHDSYPGNVSEVTKEQWAEMGYNDSSVHTDIFAYARREPAGCSLEYSGDIGGGDLRSRGRGSVSEGRPYGA